MRNKLSIAALGVAASIASATGASAAQITWNTAAISSDSVVSTTGTYLDAIGEDPNGTITVSTVPFLEGEFSGAGTTGNYDDTIGDIVVSGMFDGSGTHYTGGSAPSTGDTNFNNLLIYLGFENSFDDYLTVSLNGLNPGHQYQVQFFVYQSGAGNGNGAVITDPEDGNGPTLSASGEVATGTFVADTDPQTFEFTGPPTSNPMASYAGIFNAIQLRDITVPEPASAGLLLFAGATVLLRRRSGKRDLEICS
jgi:hypothetical protein